MPSKKQYNLVHNDEYDTRIPLHSEEAFHRGIIFHAKFIGSMEVPRPTSRVEIVAAMRRIRYEFKAKGIKKKKVTLEVSVDGLKVTLRKKKKKQQWIDENKVFQMHYPIYRIFYVSHDSHDLKIFSYIARDGNSNSFKCNVFKSTKKSQAMRVVRTVGQAFEVCHKLSLNTAAEERDDIDKDRSRERADDHLHRSDDYDDQDDLGNERQQLHGQPRSPSPNVHKDISLLGDVDDSVNEQTPTAAPCILRTHGSSASPIRQSPSGTAASDCGDLLLLGSGELTGLKHEIQLLRERLDQQGQQTRAAVAHARLLQDQLAAETAARVEAQARTHQLLVQNKELLEHIGALVGHLREQERASSGHTGIQSQVSGASASSMPSQTPTIPDLSTLGQTQLLERLHNISPYQSQRSPYATPSPYAMTAPSFLLSPSSNKPSNFNMQSSPGAMSLRVSQGNSYASSPVMSHRITSYGGTSVAESPEILGDPAAFIKPLPCTGSQRNSLHATGKTSVTVEAPGKTQEQQQPPRRITLDPPPQGKRLDPAGKQDTASRSPTSPSRNSERNETNEKTEKSPKNLATILRTPGPPPSRTTSARLPSRSDLMCQVQRTTWARHTTK